MMSAGFSVDMFLPCSSLLSKLRLISIISEACVVDKFAFFVSSPIVPGQSGAIYDAESWICFGNSEIR